MSITIGAQLYTLRDYLKTAEDVRRTFAKVREIGYPSVQVSGVGADVDPQVVADAAKENDLIIGGTHMAWDRFKNETDRVVEIHQLWGCAHAGIGGLGSNVSLEDIEQFRRDLEPVVEKLAAAGIDFSFHNHSHELVKIEGKTWLDHLYDSIPADILKAEIDVYWITAGGGDPAHWVRKTGKRQPLLHLKDMVVLPDRTQRFAPVGDGNLNWDAILQAAKDVDVKFGLVEQDQCYGEDPFECLARSYRFLSSKLK